MVKKFGAPAVSVTTAQAPASTSGVFDVFVAGQLVHSKLGGDGFIDKPAKFQKIMAAVAAAIAESKL